MTDQDYDYDYEYTEKQGQYLAFIHNYTLIHGRPPAETDMQRFFGTRAPTVHQMVVRLGERGVISREPGESRTIRVLVPADQLPRLREPSAQHRRRSQATPAKAQIYQIKVTLNHSKPSIWRRILVPSDITLEDLHYILQVAMGWTNSHLHQFIVGRTSYGEPHPDYDLEMRDERRVRLNQVIAGEGFKFAYEYDFGDSWVHTLLVETILPLEAGRQYPVCVKGRRACPPEDVGGMWGYGEFLEAIRDADHPRHEEYLVWAGGELDPDEFDLEETNEILSGLR